MALARIRRHSRLVRAARVSSHDNFGGSTKVGCKAFVEDPALEGVDDPALEGAADPGLGGIDDPLGREC